VKPFLWLSVRPEEDAAREEYGSMQQGMGVGPDGLHCHQLTRTPLPEIDLNAWSGILIGGSPFNASDDESSKSELQRRVEADLDALLDRTLAADFPLLGTCYGVGTVGRHQGGLIDRTWGEPAGRVLIELTCEGATDPLFGTMPTSFEAFVGHKEAVTRLPENAVLLASSRDCPVQAFRIGVNTYVTQFHPELDSERLCERITAYQHAGYFEPDQLESLKSMARERPVDTPQQLLAAFARRYAC